MTDEAGDFVSNVEQVYLEQILQQRNNELRIELMNTNDLQVVSRMIQRFSSTASPT